MTKKDGAKRKVKSDSQFSYERSVMTWHFSKNFPASAGTKICRFAPLRAVLKSVGAVSYICIQPCRDRTRYRTPDL